MRYSALSPGGKVRSNNIDKYFEWKEEKKTFSEGEHKISLPELLSQAQMFKESESRKTLLSPYSERRSTRK